MALTEAEELELLELENENAHAAKGVASAVPAPPEEKGFLRRAAESVVESPALPIAGSIVGGLLSSPTGPGAMGGAALGGAAGKAYQQIGKKALGLDAPETSAEAAKEIGIEGAAQAIGQVTGEKIVGPALKAVGNVLKKPAGQLFQIVTKIKPEDAATLFKNPKAILPSTMAKAKDAWRKAAKAAGIDVDEVSPALLNALKTDAKDTVYTTFERLKAGDKLTVGQVQLAKEALDTAVMPVAKNERNKKLVAILEGMRKDFVKRISDETPELAAANKGYAIGKAGEKFRSLFPRNLDGSPAYFRSTVLPAAIFGSGIYGDDTIGGATKAGAAVALSSPLALGALISGAGALRGVAPSIGRGVIASLSNLASDYANKRTSTSDVGKLAEMVNPMSASPVKAAPEVMRRTVDNAAYLAGYEAYLAGDYITARKEWERAFSLNPQMLEAREGLERLEAEKRIKPGAGSRVRK